MHNLSLVFVLCALEARSRQGTFSNAGLLIELVFAASITKWEPIATAFDLSRNACATYSYLSTSSVCFWAQVVLFLIFQIWLVNILIICKYSVYRAIELHFVRPAIAWFALQIICVNVSLHCPFH